MERSGAIALGVVAAVAVVAAGAFAVTTLLDGGPAAVDQVPAGVDAVVRVDTAITEDRVSRALVRAGVESAPVLGVAPTNVSTLLGQFERRTGLDPAGADEVAAFGWRANGSTTVDAAGVVVHGDWSSETVRGAVADNGSRNLTATTYRGQTVYQPADGESGTWLGVLGDGQFVLGSERAVKRSVDVATGDTGGLDGRLRSTYDASEDGLVIVVARVPAEQVPDAAGQAVDLTRYRQVTVVAGSYYTTDTGAGVEVRLRTNATEAARDVEDVTAGGLAIIRGTVSNETVETNLRAVEITREETTVVLRYERSVNGIEALVRYYRGLGAGAAADSVSLDGAGDVSTALAAPTAGVAGAAADGGQRTSATAGGGRR
jgi:hypothetical protein